MIEKIALSVNSPIYGRRTGQYLVSPMNFFDASLFLEKMDIESRIKTYSVSGGIPLYLNEFSDYSNFSKALKEKVLSAGEFLLEEGRFLTLEEFSRTQLHISIFSRQLQTDELSQKRFLI